MKSVLILAYSFLFFTAAAMSQQGFRPFTDTSQWFAYNNKAKLSDTVAVLQSEKGVAMLVLQDSVFTDGIVELDLKGRDVQGQSFLGLAFNLRSEQLYEVIYFRPFNFRNPERNGHSVQYSFEPAFPWHVLRENFPGKYENKIAPAPVPEEWLHARFEFTDKSVKVFVNDNPLPSLVVDRLAANSGGKIALWVSSGVEGKFKNIRVERKSPPAYGYSNSAGKYFEVAPKTKLYYEEYGEGKPILLLHGGVYGYIDEFEYFIRELSKHNRVIALATRGHVKSDVGHEPYTWQQRAEDAKRLLDHLQIDSSVVIGFSDGGFAAMTLAALYPQKVSRMVVIGAGDKSKQPREKLAYKADELKKSSGNYFSKRLANMPEPNRWQQSLDWLNALYNQQLVGSETLRKIKCPVLLLAGDRDRFSPPSTLLLAKESIAKASISIIPDCEHVVFYCNWPAVWEAVRPFVHNK